MTTEDRELLEWAAKSVGIKLEINVYGSGNYDAGFWTAYGGIERHSWNPWDPIKDDGDALRLAVKLKLHIKLTCIGCTINAPLKGVFLGESCEDDEYATTRRAIVRAATAIGRSMV